MGDRRKLNNEALHNLYISPCIITMIKARSKRWLVYVACNEETRNACTALMGNPEAKNYYENLDFGGRMIL
jgi:hypothetical protein